MRRPEAGNGKCGALSQIRKRFSKEKRRLENAIASRRENHKRERKERKHERDARSRADKKPSAKRYTAVLNGDSARLQATSLSCRRKKDDLVPL